ncbi:hypothetical protein [Aliidiomarina celeris]|uniref:hypothetical protein n=1 Tax=Aliidiomarina celeris TaxID=2249428 RepID=UPI000DE8617A|nr:hypothetical protein [Aliidiomarina celeris]
MTKAGLRIVLLMCSSLFCLYWTIGIPSFAHQSEAPALTLTGPSGAVSEGYFRLHAEGDDTLHNAPAETQLLFEQSDSEDFASVIRRYPAMGEFNQVALSGFSDGRYYFRAAVFQATNAERVAVSNVVTVHVQHHSLNRALTLFAIGAGIFILLVLTILRYHLQTKREGTEHD